MNRNVPNISLLTVLILFGAAGAINISLLAERKRVEPSAHQAAQPPIKVER